MTSTSYIVMYNILYLLNNDVVFSSTLIILNVLLLIIMGWARIIKKCHNLFQVIGGTMIGSIIAYYFYKIDLS